jgi:hypothetical protein
VDFPLRAVQIFCQQQALFLDMETHRSDGTSGGCALRVDHDKSWIHCVQLQQEQSTQKDLFSCGPSWLGICSSQAALQHTSNGVCGAVLEAGCGSSVTFKV